MKYMKYIFYTGVFVGVFLIANYLDNSTPTETELDFSDYHSICSEEYDNRCKGKYIIWDGTVVNVSDEYVRVAMDDSNTFDFQDIDGNKAGLVEGQRVRGSGWLDDENIIYPDIVDSEIIALENASSAIERRRNKEREAKQRSEKRKRVEEQELRADMDKIEHIKMVLDQCVRTLPRHLLETEALVSCVRNKGVSSEDINWVKKILSSNS